MSSMGMWIVGALPAEDATRLAEEMEGAPLPPGYADELNWWRTSGSEEPFFTSSQSDPSTSVPTPAAHRFAELVAAARLPDHTRDTAVDALGAAAEEERFTVTAREMDPAAALCHGLGPSGTAQLPGRFGEFALRPEAVGDALELAEEVLGATGDQRARVLEKVTEWASGMGDEPDLDAAELLDAPLRILHRAAALGVGAAGVTVEY
ncbi:hypothetical protein CDO52_21545 [Nocardiopsis gilva YIM 90087]|uniref:Uncharacterized protein n=1 Tax=Nocardiopsis gilva YIM 90087 TaxID=1235441 RepID=A0A223SAA2_9ACTN|nr:hypothetical protein [Nocardiopsis gilva]ASU85033.1 hypothetical protein CDO52_21545 [Nocardiopsis gilva YIM 90087]